MVSRTRNAELVRAVRRSGFCCGIAEQERTAYTAQQAILPSQNKNNPKAQASVPENAAKGRHERVKGKEGLRGNACRWVGRREAEGLLPQHAQRNANAQATRAFTTQQQARHAHKQQ